MIYFYVTLGMLFLLALSIVVYTLKNGISPMPTSLKVKEALFRELPLLEKKVIADLGSGWGHLLFPLSRKYTSCQVIGLENSPLPYLFSRLLPRRKNITIFYRDFFTFPLNEVDLVFCYLFPKGMEKVRKKLEKELKEGVEVISLTFAIPNWHPVKIVYAKDIYISPIYFYRFPYSASFL